MSINIFYPIPCDPFRPELSPEGVAGKTTVLLPSSNRAWGLCGRSGGWEAWLWGRTRDGRGVAAWGARADRLLSAGAGDTSRARSRRICTLMN